MTRSLRTVRRTAAVLGVVAAPLAFAASFGVASAEATPWRIGPLYRAETSGESAEYVCNKALAMEKSSRAVVLEPCAYDAAQDVWYRVVFAPGALGFGSSS